MTSDPTIRAQGYQYFLQEAPELLQVLEEGLLTLQEDSSINKVNTLMRATHTLKGAAASLDLETIAAVAHSLEDVFRTLCRPDVSIDGEVDALLFEGFECLRSALRAELTETTINEDEILNRTAIIFAQLQDHLGDCFDQSIPPPTSAELGFDVTQSIFEVGVAQRLEQLTTVLETEQPSKVLSVLQTQAEVFLGLGESLNLPGFSAIARAAIAALQQHPEQAKAIAQLALQDFQAGQAAVLAGDRAQGGEPSEALLAIVQGQEQDPDQFDYEQRNRASVVEDAVTAVQWSEQALYASDDGVASEAVTSEAVTLEAVTLEAVAAGEEDAPPEDAMTAEQDDPPEDAMATEADDPPEDAMAVEETSAPGIHKFFQWMRNSVQPRSEPVSEAGAALPDSAETLDEMTSDLELAVDDAEPSLSSDQGDSADIDVGADIYGDAYTYGDAEIDEAALLENIWGGAAAPAEADLEADLEPTALSLSSEAIATNVDSEAAAEPEVLTLKELSTPQRPTPQRPSRQEPTPLPHKGGASPSPTIRIEIEHLDQLNYAIGELLTNHNQQSLQSEQIQAAMRRLYARLQQHQDLLSQLQDWTDAPQLQQNRPQNGSGSTVSGLPSITPPFQVESLRTNQSPPSSRIPIGFDALELDQYSEPQLVIQALLDDTVQLTEAVDAVELFTRQSRQAQENQGRLLYKTRDALIEGRMFPLEQLFERFPRVLQQLETLHHKPVELTMQGTEVLVDKAIGEKLYDPILHLLRNAFDHGIEPVEVRQQRAKPRAGRLEIAAHNQGKHLVIEVRDDGQGIDFERIRQRAIERQMVTFQQAHQLSPAQLTDLLFEPGFSTVTQISSLSGRGVGLDVVRNQVQALQGEIAVTSVAEQGTTFTLRIPLSLTVAKLLLCQADARTYALLPDAVEQIIIPQAGQIQQRARNRALWWGEKENACLVPVYRLSGLLGYHAQAQQLPNQSTVPSQDRNPTPHILLIRRQGALAGLEVEQMLGEQELVIRPLNPLLKTHSYIYGASILADGQLTLVLDSATLVEASSQQANPNVAYSPALDPLADPLADPLTGSLTDRLPDRRPDQLRGSAHHHASPADPSSETRAKVGQKLLVVDDSITTRQTLTLTLQRAGYQVIQAQDGQEAVDHLLHHPNIQLVICDVEMPRMNGFEFLQHCQLDSNLAGIPVAMLSSRSSAKHRLLAEQLGAIAYISKPYLEHQLLTVIAKILKADLLSPISG